MVVGLKIMIYYKSQKVNLLQLKAENMPTNSNDLMIVQKEKSFIVLRSMLEVPELFYQFVPWQFISPSRVGGGVGKMYHAYSVLFSIFGVMYKLYSLLVHVH